MVLLLLGCGTLIEEEQWLYIIQLLSGGVAGVKPSRTLLLGDADNPRHFILYFLECLGIASLEQRMEILCHAQALTKRLSRHCTGEVGNWLLLVNGPNFMAKPEDFHVHIVCPKNLEEKAAVQEAWATKARKMAEKRKG